MSRKYHFPLLDTAVICEKLNESFPDLGVNAADFRQLNSERLQGIYLKIMCALCSVTKDQLMQPSLEVAFQQEYKDLHEEADYRVKFSMAMSRILYTCGVDDFTIDDILEPNLKRTVRHLSALLNFVAFFQSRLDGYEGIKEEQKAKMEQQRSLTQENEDLRRQINDLKASQAAQGEEAEQLNGVVCELRTELQELQRISNEKVKSVSSKKQHLSERKAKLAQLQASVAALKEKSAELSGQIVQSPDRMKKEQERMSIQVEQLRLTLQGRNERSTEIQKQRASTQALEAEMDGLLKQFSVIKSSVENNKLEQEGINKLREQCDEYREKLEELGKNEQLLRRRIHTKQEKTHKLRLQNENELSCLKQEKETLTRELSSRETAEMGEVSTIRREMQALSDEQERADAEHQAVMMKLRDKYARILEYVESYHSQWAQAWEEGKERLDKAASER